jgi:diketogulonate reductase-like aldo/keto reductase
VGKAIHESGLAREDIFVTTKYSGMGGLDIRTSIYESLRKVSMQYASTQANDADTYYGTSKLGLKYMDLYLIHHPLLAEPNFATIWREFEKIKADGLAK